MANQRDIDRCKKGKDQWNKWATKMLDGRAKLINNKKWKDDGTDEGRSEETIDWMDAATADFSDHIFEDHVDFQGFVFPHRAIFNAASFRKNVRFVSVDFLEGVEFNEARFHGNTWFDGSNFKGDAEFQKASFDEYAQFERVVFERAKKFHQVIFYESSNFRQSNLSRADFSNAILRYAHLEDVNLSGVNFKKTLLTGANLLSADLQNADLEEASLEVANLEGAKLHNSTLKNANMQRAIFDHKTRFDGAKKVDGCKVDRYALECLEDYGGLTVGARMVMDIHDDVAKLRASYSGFLQWVHIASLIGFLFPYLWFVVAQYGSAKFLPENSDNFIPLWQALLQFIFTGGEDWQSGFHFHWSFLLFLAALVYNGLRALLLMKTKKLELAEDASGLPAAFNIIDEIYLSDKFVLRWEHLYRASRVGFIIYLLAVLINLWHFFTMEIPLNP